MPAKRKGPVEPWQEFDWSSNGPYGAAPYIDKPRPCVICHEPAHLLSPRKPDAPIHKTCAEAYYLVSQLAPILRALNTEPRVTSDALH